MVAGTTVQGPRTELITMSGQPSMCTYSPSLVIPWMEERGLFVCFLFLFLNSCPLLILPCSLLTTFSLCASLIKSQCAPHPHPALHEAPSHCFHFQYIYLCYDFPYICLTPVFSIVRHSAFSKHWFYYLLWTEADNNNCTILFL